MSMVARPEAAPARDDIPDTDDGDATITAGAFWPEIVLRELRLAVRLPGRITSTRLAHVATGAVAHVTREPWLTSRGSWKSGRRRSLPQGSASSQKCLPPPSTVRASTYGITATPSTAPPAP